MQATIPRESNVETSNFETGAAKPARPRSARRTVLKAVGGVALFLLVATAFIGYLHTKSGHPLLMRLAGLAGCPMGGANAERVETVRRAAVAKDRGAEPAPLRPALGFALDTSTLADVRAWEKRVGIECTEERGGTLVSCTDVASTVLGRPAAEGTIAELSFGFSPKGPLVSVTTLYSNRTADDTAKIASEVEAALVKELGAAHASAGSFAQVGSTATVGYRYRDYAVDLTASRIPGSGYAVREQYMSAL